MRTDIDVLQTYGFAAIVRFTRITGFSLSAEGAQLCSLFTVFTSHLVTFNY